LREAKFVAELAGADDATAAWAHNDIDCLDSELRQSSRVAEGLTSSHTLLISEASALGSELAEATEIVEQEARAKDLAAFQNQINQAKNDADDAMGKAREALAALKPRGMEWCAEIRRCSTKLGGANSGGFSSSAVQSRNRWLAAERWELHKSSVRGEADGEEYSTGVKSEGVHKTLTN
jgi:hypothetical protein